MSARIQTAPPFLRSWRIGCGALALATWLATGQCLAEPTPVGLWQTFDDDSGKANSLVRITDHDGILDGRIEKLLDPDDSANAVCARCPDERRNQRLLGMVILRNVRKAASARTWEGGDILDPEDGRIYRVRLVPSPDGRRLEVRGYIGTPLLGRSQTWLRVE